MDFIKTLYEETALLFEEGEVKFMARMRNRETGEFDPAVRIIHIATSTMIDVDEFDTQQQNAVVARLRLHQALQ